jgi:hypothetical protein
MSQLHRPEAPVGSNSSFGTDIMLVSGYFCDARLRREYHHSYGHEFPRGYSEMKETARLMRDLADAVS